MNPAWKGACGLLRSARTRAEVHKRVISSSAGTKWVIGPGDQFRLARKYRAPVRPRQAVRAVLKTLD
jgi:hypothetical protein